MKRFLKILALIIVLLFLGGWWFANSLKPTYNGTVDIKNIQEKVEVYYDTYGVPHIYAQNENDAFTALGYVHAQDRLWQMELLRRIPTGRLAEIFGEELVKTDRLFIGLGIDEASERTIAKIDTTSKSYQLTKAYLNGINQFIEEGPKPIEFYLTGIERQPFTVKDVQNVTGYMAFSFAMAHKTDPLLTNIKNKLGTQYLTDLAIDTTPSSEFIKNYSQIDSLTVSNSLMASIDEALSNLPMSQFIGSNSWVIGPQKTSTGKVLFANDPHMGFSQPSLWYEAHVHTPNYEMYGYHVAGYPFPVLGHNRKIAYGMTMFENDDIDFYWEENHPTDANLYKTPEGWKTYETRTKTIKVKDGDDVSVTIKTSRHGPIMNDVVDEISFNQPIAMSWVYTQLEDYSLEAFFYKISHATNQKEFEEALPLLHAPGLNIMYGDAENNIGWYATAKLYELPKTSHSKFIMDGTNGENERIRYLDFSENPKAINPPWHYVYSANNQPDSISGMLYPGYYLPENRAKRIVQLLEPKNDWNKTDVTKMITDVTSSVNPTIAKALVSQIDRKDLNDNQKEALDILQNWNGDNQLQDVAPTVYHKFIYLCLKNTLQDELGEDMFTQIMKTHLIKRTIAPLFTKENSIWFDNIETKDKSESRKDIVSQSYKEAILALEKQLGSNVSQWTWNKAHTLEHQHPIGKVDALRSYFNVGPFEINGTREVINNLAFFYDDSGEYKVTTGPSTRRVIDFSDIENSMSILPTGQSGNPLSPHYKDQAELYNKGEFRKMMMNEEEIKSTSKNVLIIK
ncbi:Penicillin amidase family protein [hydrothermal vent metagenome]|uniref:Penicillin amidase family protein n=1 Tax=hydrothermal vent metagenome TaxID=652676 RepID=A0A3B0R7L8_9ZZZZ